MKQQNGALLIEAVPIAVILIHEKVTRNNNGDGNEPSSFFKLSKHRHAHRDE